MTHPARHASRWALLCVVPLFVLVALTDVGFRLIAIALDELVRQARRLFGARP